MRKREKRQESVEWRKLSSAPTCVVSDAPPRYFNVRNMLAAHSLPCKTAPGRKDDHTQVWQWYGGGAVGRGGAREKLPGVYFVQPGVVAVAVVLQAVARACE